MKVYVDELPECCCECACCNHDVDYGACCNLGAFDYGSDHQTLYKHPRCPLQSLTDHDKQVRKKVCEKISEKVKNFNKVYLYPDYTKSDAIECILDDIEEILDQIQGEAK